MVNINNGILITLNFDIMGCQSDVVSRGMPGPPGQTIGLWDFPGSKYVRYTTLVKTKEPKVKEEPHQSKETSL